MADDTHEHEQPALWGDTTRQPGRGRAARRRRARSASQPIPPASQPWSAPQRGRGTSPLLPVTRPVAPMEHRDLWDIDEVANYLGVPKQTVYSWRTTGYGPRGFRVGKHLRWRSATVIAWTLGLEKDQGPA